jgi:hypothetical protein
MTVETITEMNPELAEYNLDDYDEEKPVAQGTIPFDF